MKASQKSNRIDIVEYLLTKGADMNIKNNVSIFSSWNHHRAGDCAELGGGMDKL